MFKILVSLILTLTLSLSGFVGSLFQQAAAPELPETLSYSQRISSDSENVLVLSELYQNLDKPIYVAQTEPVVIYQEATAPSDEEAGQLFEPEQKEQPEPEANPILEPAPVSDKKDEKIVAVKTESKPIVEKKVAVVEAVEEPVIAPVAIVASVAVAPVAVPAPVLDEKTNDQAEESVPAGASSSQAVVVAPQPTAVPVQVAKPIEEKPAVIEDGKVYDLSRISSGILGVRYLNPGNKRIRLLIDKEGTRYTYNLKADNSLESFPLQSGNGDYKVSIMENTEGNKYRYVLTEIIQVKLSNTNSLYLGSIQMINWNDNMAAIKKAKELTAGTDKDIEKIKAVYAFVVRTIQYDYDKLNNLPSTYLPNIDETLRTQKGICYDSASLTASMLRSQGIPTKLVMGYAEGVNGYHAWNEIYVESTGKWIVVDTSVDSQLRARNASYSMEKNSKLYQKVKEY